MRTYKELSSIPDFHGRFEYLKLDGVVGDMNLDVNRWLNQRFYHTAEWKRLRNSIIVRDGGFDLGVKGYSIFGRPIIHHIEPINLDDVLNRSPKLFDPDNLILVSHETHNAIHYGNESLIPKTALERTPGDTKLW